MRINCICRRIPLRYNALNVQKAAVAALEDIKARDITVLDTRPLTAIYDTLIVATAESARQTKALARHVSDKVKEAGGQVLSIEGEGSGEWVLVDCTELVVHIMLPTTRALYNLEELWTAPKPIKRVAAVKVAEPAVEAAPVTKAAKKAPAKKAAAKAPEVATTVDKVPAKKAAAAKTPAAKKPVANARVAEAVAEAVKKPATKKPPAKKPAAKKPAAKAKAVATKTPAVKKPAAKKVTAKTVEIKRPSAKAPAAKAPAAKRPVTKPLVIKRPSAKKKSS